LALDVALSSELAPQSNAVTPGNGLTRAFTMPRSHEGPVGAGGLVVEGRGFGGVGCATVDVVLIEGPVGWLTAVCTSVM